MEKHVVHDYVSNDSWYETTFSGFIRAFRPFMIGPCPWTVQPSVELRYFWLKRETYELSAKVKFYTMTSCVMWSLPIFERETATPPRRSARILPWLLRRRRLMSLLFLLPIPLQQANRNLHTSLCLSHVTQFEIATCRLSQHSQHRNSGWDPGLWVLFWTIRFDMINLCKTPQLSTDLKLRLHTSYMYHGHGIYIWAKTAWQYEYSGNIMRSKFGKNKVLWCKQIVQLYVDFLQ